MRIPSTASPTRLYARARLRVPWPASRSGGSARGRFRLLLQRGQLGLQARADPRPIQAQQDATHPRAALEADRSRHPRPAGGGRQLPAPLAADPPAVDANPEPPGWPCLEALQRDPDDHEPHPEAGVPARACRRPVRAGWIEIQPYVAPRGAARVVERGPYDVRWRVHKEAALDGPAQESWMGTSSHTHRLVDRPAVSMPGLSHRPRGAPSMPGAVVTWSARAASRSA